MLKALIVTALTIASVVLASPGRNPVVLSPKNATFNAGDEIDIKWSGASTGFVNIDLVNVFPEVLSSPITIALGVPAGQNNYKWTIPSFLKTAVGYQVRVWGVAPPRPEEKSGQAPLFTIFNNIPRAVNAFKVLKPNSDSPCAVGKPCQIEWDFPENINGPAYVHIRLFKAGQSSPIAEIADVPASQKQYTWNIPSEKGLIANGLYVSVSGAGTPPAGPGFSNDMGGNGQAFAIAAELPAAPAAADGYKFGEQGADIKAQVDTITSTSTVTNISLETNTVTETSNAAAADVRTMPLAAYGLFVIIPAIALFF